MTSFPDLQSLMTALRDPENGCPWSSEQTMHSLVQHTLEEVYEVIEAIETNNIDSLRSELADLLLQIGFYSEIAKENGWFTLDDVEQDCINKQLMRKPHLRNGEKVTSEQAIEAWETIKAEARNQLNDCFDDIAKTLPALSAAKKVQQRAKQFSFDWDDMAPVIEKYEEELAEVKQALAQGNQAEVEEEIGDLLFTCVNIARHAQVDPEQALLQANRKFKQRFLIMQDIAKQKKLDFNQLSLEQLDELWEMSKE